ncbi:MAG: cell division protein FtsQ/DivIB [Burkholderiales bacterium]|jgi:cell division protein FtsQ
MWDNADMLNGCANALYALAAAALVFTGGYALLHSSLLPLRTLTLQGDLRHVTREQAERAAHAGVTSTFISVDLDAVRGAFESLPWVRKVEVRRVWPDRLQVSIEEHVALARWGTDAHSGRLVNTYGEVFEGELPEAASLPQFAGPSGSAEELTRRYAAFRQALAPLRLEPKQVLLSARYSWQLRLSNGLTLELGRDQLKEPVLQRLTRFVAYYAQTLGKLNRKFEYADLRYPSGFALRVPGIMHSGKEPGNVGNNRRSGEKA